VLWKPYYVFIGFLAKVYWRNYLKNHFEKGHRGNLNGFESWERVRCLVLDLMRKARQYDDGLGRGKITFFLKKQKSFKSEMVKENGMGHDLMIY